MVSRAQSPGRRAVKGRVMDLSHERPMQRHGLLYPMMVIAAIAVIVFSIVGIATIAGWMPSALSATSMSQAQALGHDPADALPRSSRSSAAFECAECGMIESIREYEQREMLTSLLRVESQPVSRL
jgi:hypothetical protein